MHLLPDVVSELLERHEQCHTVRRAVWREHTTAGRAWSAAYERIAAVTEASGDRSSAASMSTDWNYDIR